MSTKPKEALVPDEQETLTTDNKSQPAKDSAIVEYDARAKQTIPLTLEKNGTEYRVAHVINPLEPARYFAYEEEIATLAQRVGKAGKINNSITDPQYNLWLDLVESREGYAERDDWKERTHRSDAIAVIVALLGARILSEKEVETPDGGAVYDEDALTKIHLQVLQSGTMVTLSLSFREETKAESNTFLSIDADVPDDNALASAEKLSKSEKLFRLGRPMVKEVSGYAEGSEPPPWHIAAATQEFFNRQVARMGKYSKPWNLTSASRF